ncbi:MAG TPA: hypothetical protein DEG17_01200 [Cyanobacteria bacterium UBA11149]|nr:hypothetical protein [Cyanobacteria bacterium UBA11367]HBE56121.1 hypothetical protein [Cyanobacteria bacterium UBA11366]HBK64796.1 hypothetical protein [Cyanobacteria bacterium UBA11166]HBR76010.1 hypothetical protein [Cyanobacteria bacterium UBA11159]HBS72121.1 hypothetical protein [Cyanobacteria bacterium UBA11153]HBW87530.1 hypothetical protein [Cyanobacteria bacterium UBA11149]HCA96266.1 hypothetical protein [Cyanobacteria bacterium UBA9226]
MPHWSTGQTLDNGKYTIQKTLGGGGFGITYLATEKPSGKLVAIKTLNATQQAKPNFTSLQNKFVQEAFRLAKCRHPHIVSVYTVFPEGDLWHLVMEYVEGDNLADYLADRGIFRETEALRIIQEIGDALSYLHGEGLLHRDIKPQNIMLRRDNLSAVLIDFGLAREFSSGYTQSLTSDRTERYAPIEQYEKRGKFGAYTDVYALAVTLYHLLTEDLPPSADVRKKFNLTLPPPQQYNSQISDKVNNAILKGMELEAKNRPQSVAEWLKILTPPPTPPLQGEGSKNKNNLTPPFPQREGGLGGLGLFSFEFETVTVDIKGKITNRRRLQAQYFIEKLAKDINLEMVSIPGGTFMMGSPESEKGHSSDESPQHKVTVPPFFMGKYPVTQAQWRVVAGLPQINRSLNPNPSHFKGDNLPVEQILWVDAAEFCARLSEYTGQSYRLPSESEWEYACRAGTTTPFHFGETITTDLANYDGDGVYGQESKGIYRQSTTEVSSSGFANSFGLYDMHGNVWFWCADTWNNNYTNAPNDGSPWIDENNINIRLLRGGSWYLNPRYCRSAYRSRNTWDERLNDGIGFRLVCCLPRTH